MKMPCVLVLNAGCLGANGTYSQTELLLENSC